MQILVDAGADANVRDATNGNPVLYSSFFWSSDVVQILVDAGADVNARTANGNTLLYEAITLARRAFFSSDEERYRAIVEILVDTGADVNAKDSEGNPILYTAFFWDADAVQILIDAGADVNATIADGNTLLYEAVRLASSAFFSSDKERYQEIVKNLVDAGARQ